MEKTMELTGREQGRRILRRLEQAGFQAYFVGGCVRDLLLGRPVHDWDIATSARPEQVLALFPHCVPTGLRHGTVSVLEGGCRTGGAGSAPGRAFSAHSAGRDRDALSIKPALAKGSPGLYGPGLPFAYSVMITRTTASVPISPL